MEIIKKIVLLQDEYLFKFVNNTWYEHLIESMLDIKEMEFLLAIIEILKIILKNDLVSSKLINQKTFGVLNHLHKYNKDPVIKEIISY